jgi:hypothetical protein
LKKKTEGDQEEMIFEAYKGMLHYTQWLSSKHKVEAFKAHTGGRNDVKLSQSYIHFIFSMVVVFDLEMWLIAHIQFEGVVMFIPG